MSLCAPTLALKVARWAVVVAASAAAGGCYSATGTAAIGAKDVKRRGAAAPSTEQSLLARVKPESPSIWRHGKEWHVTSARIALVMRGLRDTAGLSGARLRYIGARAVPTLTGTQATSIDFTVTSSPGDTLSYICREPIDSFMRREYVRLPFTVEMAPVMRADSLLRDRTLYPLTSSWLTAPGIYVTGRRYMPVRVDSVTPGGEQTPLLVHFTTLTGEQDSAYLPLSLTADGRGTRDFAAVFSLSDPRLRHPEIYPDVWELITRGEVRPEMTREECRLALGAPEDSRRQELYGMTREIWNYGNGRCLIFEDGVLKSATR